MSSFAFHDGNITHSIDSLSIHSRRDVKHSLQMHSSMIQRLSLERELEGHLGCVNTIAWNSKGSLLISGSDDTRINIWRYSDQKLVNSIDSGHSANIFCTKFVPETSDELVASGAGDAEVRVFNISHLSGSRVEETDVTPSAHFQCHTRRVKKLAVEVGNPNLIWSASEDGTLRQHDLREGCSCPPAGSSNQECRSVLLDLRCAAKRSLAEPPKKQPLHLKSCDISVTKPHLLLVGGSDAFARLYDRRMLPPLSSCQMNNAPPPCVNYFCPMHLSESGQSSLHLTHVAFSPHGEEVLINYSGEHIYLMDLNQGGLGSTASYTSGDVAKLWCSSPNLNGVELAYLKAAGSQSISSAKSNVTVQRNKCRKLVEVAEKCLQDGADYYTGIEACNEVLDGGYNVDSKLKHDCLCTRAVLLLKRKWKNDAYMAIRDLYQARKIDSSSFKALYYMSEALSELGKHKEALDFALAAQCVVPSAQVTERIEAIRKQLSAAGAENNKKSNDRRSKAGARGSRVISLSDILYRSEGNSDNSQDGPTSERDDSDYDEELELDLETSISGDEDHEFDPNLHESLNLRIHRRPYSREAGVLNGSCGSPSSSHQHDKSSYQPESVIDMKQRYVGHCNVGTDIKQASFLGQNGDYISGGSDDGRWFIWEKKTGRLIKMLLGDEAVVNCIQCHPFDSVVATSGIDNTIKIWTPSAHVPSMVAGGSASPDTATVLEAMEGNQRRLCRAEAILPLELLNFECMILPRGRSNVHKASFHPFQSYFMTYPANRRAFHISTEESLYVY